MRTLEGGSSVVQELKDAQLRIRGVRKISTGSSSSDSEYSRMNSKPQLDENGLVVPKKLYNPCMESRDVQDLNREIKWNAKAGINVLNNKTELERAMEKRSRHIKEKQRLIEEESKQSPFQKMLDDRAKRLERLETGEEGGHSSEDSGHCSPEPESEFLKVHAQLTAGKFSS